jgi:hypothetical protein
MWELSVACARKIALFTGCGPLAARSLKSFVIICALLKTCLLRTCSICQHGRVIELPASHPNYHRLGCTSRIQHLILWTGKVTSVVCHSRFAHWLVFPILDSILITTGFGFSEWHLHLIYPQLPTASNVFTSLDIKIVKEAVKFLFLSFHNNSYMSLGEPFIGYRFAWHGKLHVLVQRIFERCWQTLV